MNKIYFIIDGIVPSNVINDCLVSYESTEQALSNGIQKIVTYSLAHLSFDLLDMGYDIYLCYKEKCVKIEPGMELHLDGSPCKEIRKGHDVFKLFRAGVFNEMLGIK